MVLFPVPVCKSFTASWSPGEAKILEICAAAFCMLDNFYADIVFLKNTFFNNFLAEFNPVFAKVISRRHMYLTD